jgi:hypothetical protein
LTSSIQLGIWFGNIGSTLLLKPLQLFYYFDLVSNLIFRTPRQAATFILELAFQQIQPEGDYFENGRIIDLHGTEDSDKIWMVGKSVREMIVDNDASFSSTNEIPNGETLYESIKDDSVFEESEQLLTPSTTTNFD